MFTYAPVGSLPLSSLGGSAPVLGGGWVKDATTTETWAAQAVTDELWTPVPITNEDWT